MQVHLASDLDRSMHGDTFWGVRSAWALRCNWRCNLCAPLSVRARRGHRHTRRVSRVVTTRACMQETLAMRELVRDATLPRM